MLVPSLHKVIATLSSTDKGILTTCLRWRWGWSWVQRKQNVGLSILKFLVHSSSSHLATTLLRNARLLCHTHTVRLCRTASRRCRRASIVVIRASSSSWRRLSASLRLLAALSLAIAVLRRCLRLLQSQTSAKRKRRITVSSSAVILSYVLRHNLLRTKNAHVNAKWVETGSKPVSLTRFSCACERGECSLLGWRHALRVLMLLVPTDTPWPALLIVEVSDSSLSTIQAGDNPEQAHVQHN